MLKLACSLSMRGFQLVGSPRGTLVDIRMLLKVKALLSLLVNTDIHQRML